MTSNDREDDYNHLYSQAINTNADFNLNMNTQQHWRPIPGVGVITIEQFVGNHMVDSNKTSVNQISNEYPPTITDQIVSQFPLKNPKPLIKNAHYMDISEHRALLADERLSQMCVSHIESPNLVYMMSENDYERAIKLLEAMKSIEIIGNQEPFRPIENRLCAVKNNNEWLRGRCHLVSTDKQIVKVRYIDWGNTVHIKTEDIRRLPNELVLNLLSTAVSHIPQFGDAGDDTSPNFGICDATLYLYIRFYQESACCLPCRLDGLDDITFDNKILHHCNEILIGSNRGEFDLDLIVTKIAKMNELAHIVLYRKSNNLNDEIYKYLPSNKQLNEEQHLVEQFTHEFPLIIGEQYRALLSSFNGKDNSFYISVDNNNYNEIIDEVLNQITDSDQSCVLIRPFMMVCVKYDGKYTRAWIKSIDNDQYQVFYVDWGNEEQVMKDRIRICPEKIRYIPWLANRVKFHNEQLTNEEFDEFWKTIENDYCQVIVIDQYVDHYSVEIKYDYLSMIRKRRAILFVNNNF